MSSAEPPQELSAAAKSGEVDAQVRLASWYLERGHMNHAEHWWEIAANKGNPDAQFNIGVVRQKQGDQVAETWYRKAAASGHLGAQNNLANLLRQKGDATSVADAVVLWRKGAIAGSASAQHNLSLTLMELAGEHLTGEVVHWAEVAANNGHAGAQYNLGRWMYERGNFDEGREWLRRAAANGSSAATQLLEHIRRQGDPPLRIP